MEGISCGNFGCNFVPWFSARKAGRDEGVGEFYYKRELYRKALKHYCEAYKRGFTKNYDILYKMGDIYEKLGDTRSALKYLHDAQIQSPNPELDNKIKQIEIFDSTNKEYYSNTRIRG